MVSASGFTVATGAQPADYSITYAYDNQGRFHSVSSSVVDYSYLPGSSLIASVSNSAGFASLREYEEHRNLITDINNQWNGNLISSFAYENDAVGRRTARIDTHPFVVPPSGGSSTNTFGYNIRSEVVAALMGGNDYGYKYDPIGNREQASLNAVTNFYAANALNQYTNISNGVVVEPQYDADGNMLTYNGWTFTWNGENRLIAASNTTTLISNTYDYMGRRIHKVLNGVTNTFLYDGWAMIREESASATNSYVYGIDLSGSMQGAGTIGGILSADLNGTTAFYCYDANGNVTDLVDTNGNSVAHYEYGPFGGTITQSGSLADDNPFRFSSKYLDEDVELYYYGYRYYNPELGRWLNRDPIEEEGGINLYQAMFNDLLSFIDPLGLDPCCPGGKPIDCAQLSSRINRTRNSIRGAIDQLGEIGGFFEKAEMYNRVSLGITAVQAVVGVGATAYSSLTRNLSVAATQSSRGMLSVGLHTQSGRIALAGEPGFKVAASAAMQTHNMATLSIAAKEMGPTIGTVSGSSFGNLAKRILDPFGRLSDVLTDDGARLSSEISETIKMLQELFASQLELYNECCR